jgi:hypothetical protein
VRSGNTFRASSEFATELPRNGTAISTSWGRFVNDGVAQHQIDVDEFSYLSVLLSVILGLAVTQAGKKSND